MRSPCWNDVDYPVTQPFLPGPPAIHCGIDIGCPSGTIIRAARAGIVERVQTGMVGIRVMGSNQRDFYLHGYALVVVGQLVNTSTPVIHSDTVPVDPRYPPTGPHLHFEVQDGFTLPGAPPMAPGHPLDPVPILEGDDDMFTDDDRAQMLATKAAVTRLEVLLGTALPDASAPKPPALQPPAGQLQEIAADVDAIKAATDHSLKTA